jgi:hypothetical protein
MDEMDMKSRFVSDLKRQLREIYEQLKLQGKMPAQIKSRAEGFMLAGRRLGLVEKSELETLMENVHMEVFGLSINERRLMQLKGEQFEIDWSYYDKPITER